MGTAEGHRPESWKRLKKKNPAITRQSRKRTNGESRSDPSKKVFGSAPSGREKKKSTVSYVGRGVTEQKVAGR